MILKKSCFALFVSVIISAGAFSQNAVNYDQHEAFSPLFYPENGNEIRTAAGTPGPKYWQNEADYLIKASLDDITHHISGDVVITYKNNSPERLSFLWLQLDQNIYKNDSRGTVTTPVGGSRYAAHGFIGGYNIQSVAVTYQGRELKINYLINDTRMQIFLPENMKANGDSLKIHIVYDFEIPERGSDRMGRIETDYGWIYSIGQWYPRMCVYDNVLGWNALPYLGAGEFYLDYGNYDYTITTSSKQIVVGSGELINPEDVLTAEQNKRLESARNSDKPVFIRSQEETVAGKDHLKKDKLNWHFRCYHARDVAFASSSAFMWDAARINLPDGKKSLAMSVYPIEAALEKGWKRSTEFVKATIEGCSKRWFPYTYPVAVSVAGSVSGMEYPGIIFCFAYSQGSELWGTINHEFGHNWFPMLVGSNERKFAWMDEGFNTFINGVEDQDFNHGEFAEKPRIRERSARYFQPNSESLMTIPEVTQPRYLAVNAYDKPSLGLELLRNVILGKDRFDTAFCYYIRNWAFKHPTPWDFFHAMDNASGEELSWFWKGWFMNNWKIDQAVTNVDYVQANPANGALITIQNREQLPMPVTVEIKEMGGKTGRVSFPVEIWQRGSQWKFQYPSTRKLESVTIDPDHQIPDADDTNNEWKSN
jgi:Peptidase family M1 domain